MILLSGGADSAVALYWAKNKKYRIQALIFDYKQRHRKEVECAKKISRLNKIKYCLVNTDLFWARSSLIDKRIKISLNRNLDKKEIPHTYVSGRNIIFLSYAFSLAESVGAKYIFIGAHTEDYSGYPDCRPQFLKNFQKAANSGIKGGSISIKAPLINKTKKQIIEIGLKLGVPFQSTWSCYQGKSKPCLKCDSCRFRAKAFRELGTCDPLIRKNESKSSGSF